MMRQFGRLFLAAGTITTVCLASASASATTHAGVSYTVVYETQLTGINNEGVVAPEAPQVFKAAFAGTPARVIICDDQGTTTGNITCEHDATTDHAAVFAVTQTNQDQSLVDQARIPVVGVTNDTSPESFDVSAQQALFVGMAVALHKEGCNRIGTLIDEGGQSYAAQVAQAVKWQSVTDSFMSLAAPDLSPNIAKLVDAHVQCVDLASIGTQIPQVMIAMKQAKLKVPLAIPGIIVTPSVAESLGSLGNGMIEVVSTPDPSSPAVAAVTKAVHAVNPKARIDATSLSSWVLAKIILDGAANVHGTVTNSALLLALNNLRSASTDGLLPPLSMKPQFNPAARRDFDTYVQSFVLENGKMTRPSGFFNVAKQINEALSSS
jgi:hypothetical protein